MLFYSYATIVHDGQLTIWMLVVLEQALLSLDEP